MARWQPNAPDRLAVAALELFEERGYENTTVIEIAERAGLTKSTFFRHFSDKREVLFGGGAMTELLVNGLNSAPAGAGPFAVVAHALDLIGEQAFPVERRAFAARRQAVIAANPELREREALKKLSLIDSMTVVLIGRNVADLTARVVAELGALAWEIAYDRWTNPAGGHEFGELARRALRDVLAAATTLC